MPFDILDDSVEDIVTGLYSEAYGGRDVVGCYEQPANLMLSTCLPSDADLKLEVPQEYSNDVMIHSEDADWGITFFSGDLIGAKTRSPFVHPVNAPDTSGLFGNAIKRLGELVAVLRTDGYDESGVVQWFHDIWGVKKAVNLSLHIPVVAGDLSVGLTSLDANLNPTLKAWPGRHRLVIPTWYSVDRGKVSRRAGKEVAYDFAKAREIAKYLGMTLVAEGKRDEVSVVYFRVISREAPRRVKTVGDPLTLDTKRVSPDFEENDFIKDYRRAHNLFRDHIDNPVVLHKTNVVEYQGSVLDRKDMAAFIDTDLGVDLRLLTNRKKILASLDKVKTDTTFPFEEYREDAQLAGNRPRARFQLNFEDVVSVLDLIFPRNIIHYGKDVSKDRLRDHRFAAEFRKQMASLLNKTFLQKVFIFARIVYKDKVKMAMFVRDFFKLFGYTGHIERNVNSVTKLIQGLNNEVVANRWLKVLKGLSVFRHGQGITIRFMKSELVREMIQTDNAAEAFTTIISRRVRYWANVYRARSKSRHTVDRRKAIISQLRATYLPHVAFRVDDEKGVSVSGWAEEVQDSLYATACNIAKKSRKFQGKPVDIFEPHQESVARYVRRLDRMLAPKYSFSTMLDDVAKTAELIATDVNHVLTELSNAIINREEYRYTDSGQVDDVTSVADVDDEYIEGGEDFQHVVTGQLEDILIHASTKAVVSDRDARAQSFNVMSMAFNVGDEELHSIDDLIATLKDEGSVVSPEFEADLHNKYPGGLPGEVNARLLMAAGSGKVFSV